MARKPKYRRHLARNRGFVEFNGKRHYLPGAYKSPESLEAYRAFLNQHVHRTIDTTRPAAPLVVQLVTRHLDWAREYYPPGDRSEASNIKAAMNHLLAQHALKPASEFGPKDLQAIQHRMAKAKALRTYINATTRRIRAMFKWAAAEELCSPAIFGALVMVPWLRKGRSPARESQPKQPVDRCDVDAVLPELSPTVAAMVEFQWLTGVRSQSLCLARADQLDRSKKPWEWRPRHKQEHTTELVVFVGPRAQKIIKPLLSRLGYLFAPVHHTTGKRAKRFRSFYDATSYNRAVRRAIERVNLRRGKKPQMKRWTPHQLRHARATLVRARHGLEAAQASIGHKRIDSAQIYAQAQMERAKRVALEMG